MIKLRINDEIVLDVLDEEDMYKFAKAARKAEKKKQYIEVESSDGTIRLVNPSHIIYIVEGVEL